MTEGSIEYELGVPIPGRILPRAEWARTAIKRLPESGPLDWAAIFGRSAPIVLDLGCGNGRYTISSALSRPDHDHFAVDILPVVIRYATRRANQRGLQQRPVRRQGRRDVPRTLRAGVERRRGAPLSPPALSRPSPFASTGLHSTPPGRRPPRPGPGGPIVRPDRQSGVLDLHVSRPPRLFRLERTHGSLAGRAARSNATRDPGARSGPPGLPGRSLPPRWVDDRGRRQPGRSIAPADIP